MKSCVPHMPSSCCCQRLAGFRAVPEHSICAELSEKGAKTGQNAQISRSRAFRGMQIESHHTCRCIEALEEFRHPNSAISTQQQTLRTALLAAGSGEDLTQAAEAPSPWAKTRQV